MANRERGVLLAKKKHDIAAYVFVTKEERDLAFVRLLRGNWHDGYYYKPEKPKVSAKDKVHFDMSDEEFAALPQAVQDAMRDERARVLSRFARQKQYYEDEMEMWDSIQKIVNAPTAEDAARDYRTPSGKITLAERIISARDDYEYEGIEIVYDCNQD